MRPSPPPELYKIHQKKAIHVLPQQVGAKPENDICISLQIGGFAEYNSIADIYSRGITPVLTGREERALFV